MEQASIDELERHIVRLAEDVCGRMARWLGLIAEFDRFEGARRSGFRGTAEWLAWRCGIGARAARDHVRVALRLESWPLVREAFAAGELSYSKVRAIARASEEEDEAALLALARSSTAAQLERVVRALRTAASADLDVANRGHEERYLSWYWDSDGSLRFHGRLGADEGAALIEVLETAAEAVHGDAAAGVMRPGRGARRADALTEIVFSGCPRAQVVLHVDPGSLGGVCAIEDGPAVPVETAQRLACDADLFDQGRTRRVVSPALRTSLERRDRCCRFPGCDRRHGRDAHHIIHWAHGGPTDRVNLVLLCRFHHRLVHEEGFRVGRDGAAFVFRRPDGRVVPDVPVPITVGDRRPPPVEMAA